MASVLLLVRVFFKKAKSKEAVYTTAITLKSDFVIEQKKDKEQFAVQRLRQTKTDVPFQVIKDSLVTKNVSEKNALHQTPEKTSLTQSNPDSAKGNHTDTSSSGGGTAFIGTTLLASAKTFNLAAVDKIPHFKGGDAALLKFLENNIHYSEQAKRDGIVGKIYASFIINTKGEVEAVTILKGLGSGLYEDVVRALHRMLLWEPGYFRGKPVSTILNIPVSFNLTQ